MDRLPLAWRPGLVGAAVVLVTCAIARPASLRRTGHRLALLATRSAMFVGDAVLLVEHRITRRRRQHGRVPIRLLTRLTDLVDRRICQRGAARRERIGTLPKISSTVLTVLALATFAPSAAWVVTDRWPDNPFARATRSAFSGWNGLEDRITGEVADVAAGSVAGPSTSDTPRPQLSWWLPAQDEPLRFGDPADRALAGDLDGDGASELLAFAADGTWHIAGRADPVPLGADGDVPVPADYDGDGLVELAVYRPSTGEWLVDGTDAGALGGPGLVPVPAAYTVPGVAQRAVYAPATGEWTIAGAEVSVRFGEPGDVPVPADYDGDGLAEPAVFRPATGEWWMLGVPAPVVWGTPGDVPVPAAFGGADRALPSVYRPSSGELLVVGQAAVDVGVVGGDPVVVRRDGVLTVAVVGPPG